MTTPVEDRINQEDRISRMEGAYEHLATKADVAEVKAELEHKATKADVAEVKAELEHKATKADLAELRTELEHMATKADLAELRAEFKEDMGKLQVSLIKWMIGLLAASVIANASLVLGILRIVGQ